MCVGSCIDQWCAKTFTQILCILHRSHSQPAPLHAFTQSHGGEGGRIDRCSFPCELTCDNGKVTVETRMIHKILKEIRILEINVKSVIVRCSYSAALPCSRSMIDLVLGRPFPAVGVVRSLVEASHSRDIEFFNIVLEHPHLAVMAFFSRMFEHSHPGGRRLLPREISLDPVDFLLKKRSLYSERNILCPHPRYLS